VLDLCRGPTAEDVTFGVYSRLADPEHLRTALPARAGPKAEDPVDRVTDCRVSGRVERVAHATHKDESTES